MRSETRRYSGLFVFCCHPRGRVGFRGNEVPNELGSEDIWNFSSCWKFLEWLNISTRRPDMTEETRSEVKPHFAESYNCTSG